MFCRMIYNQQMDNIQYKILFYFYFLIQFFFTINALKYKTEAWNLDVCVSQPINTKISMHVTVQGSFPM